MTSSQKKTLALAGTGVGVALFLLWLSQRETPALASTSKGATPPQPPALPPPRPLTGSQATVVTQSGPLLMRDVPATTGRVVGQIPKGDTVLLVPSAPRNGFAMVSYQGVVGWAYSGFLQSLPETRAPDPGVTLPRPEGPPPAPPPPFVPPPIRFLGNPLTLEQGKRYQARLELSGLSSLASPSQIASRFGELGFSGVRVFGAKNALPANWPRETTLSDTSNTRWVEGTYVRPSMTTPRPDLVVQVWEAV